MTWTLDSISAEDRQQLNQHAFNQPDTIKPHIIKQLTTLNNREIINLMIALSDAGKVVFRLLIHHKPHPDVIVGVISISKDTNIDSAMRKLRSMFPIVCIECHDEIRSMDDVLFSHEIKFKQPFQMVV